MVAGVLCSHGRSCLHYRPDLPYDFIILEVDSRTHLTGTPSSRIQETKKKKNHLPKLEEPPSAGLGSRLLRRLLSVTERAGFQSTDGHDNYAFEMEAPKSPWRYPHLMFRNDSKKTKLSHQRIIKEEINLRFLELASVSLPSPEEVLTARTIPVPVLALFLCPVVSMILRPTVTVPVHDHFNKLKRTDSEFERIKLRQHRSEHSVSGGSRRTGAGS